MNSSSFSQVDDEWALVEGKVRKGKKKNARRMEKNGEYKMGRWEGRHREK